jgi:LacI family transcriptional regulator
VRPTIKDIAREIGVSPNTVSKALNGKGRVSAATRQLVIDTAQRLGYHPNRSARALARRELRLAAVYPLEPAEFYSHIARGIADQAAEMADRRCTVTAHPYPSIETPRALRQVLGTVLEERPDGLVLTCSHRFEEYADVLAGFAEAGIPVFYATIFGDMVPGVIGGVRTNTQAAGRIAAEFLGLVMPAHSAPRRVALMVGAKHLLVYQECVDGFAAQAAAAQIEVAGVWETFGRADLAYEAAAEAFADGARLDGIYVASHNSVGLCDYLEDHALAGQVAVIGHDLYPGLNTKLQAGTLTATLFQSQYEQGRDALRLLAETVDSGEPLAQAVQLVEPRLVLPSMAAAFPEYL